MKAVHELTYEELMSIPETQPEGLFERANLKGQYRTLLKQWHPDINPHPHASNALMKITSMYEKAIKKTVEDIWDLPNHQTFVGLDGKRREILFRTRKSTEIGETLIGDAIVAHMINFEYRKLFEHGKDTIYDLVYGKNGDPENISPNAPRVISYFESKPAGKEHANLVLVMRKESQEVLLEDVIHHGGGSLEPVNVAWIIANLLNLSAWIAFSNLSHNALATNTIFISPKEQKISLLGGWWYATKLGENIPSVPNRTGEIIPTSGLFKRRKSETKNDIALVKKLGLEMFGELHGKEPNGPEDLIRWLKLPAGSEPYDEYRDWMDVCDKALIPRKQSTLTVTAADLYPKIITYED